MSRRPPTRPSLTADQLIANLPPRLKKHAGYNEAALQRTAELTIQKLATCSSPDHGQGDIAAQIVQQLCQDLQPACEQSSACAAPGSGDAVGFVFEGIALYLIRIFAEMAARQMLRWAWGWLQGQRG